MATDNNSLLTNLKNKIAYNIHSAVSDPAANEFATQRAQEQKAKEEQVTTTEKTPEDIGDPNKFSAVRMAKTTGSHAMTIFSYIFFPFVSLILAMIVANEMIVYSVPIRIIFFIFTFLICYFTKIFAIILGIFYILKGAYSYYYNNMTGKPKKDIMPTIFALLPITTKIPLSGFGKFMMYPFTYPKTEKGYRILPEIMRNYLNSLIESFTGFNSVKQLPVFVEGMKDIQKGFENINKIPESNTNAENVPTPAPASAPIENVLTNVKNNNNSNPK
jgi:hypothetical protein